MTVHPGKSKIEASRETSSFHKKFFNLASERKTEAERRINEKKEKKENKENKEKKKQKNKSLRSFLQSLQQATATRAILSLLRMQKCGSMRLPLAIKVYKQTPAETSS